LENTLFFDGIRRITKLRFFSRNKPPQSTWQVIAWWEARRVPYNLLVGSMGAVSTAMCLITAIVCEHYLGEPIGFPDPPFLAILAVIIYAVMANVCYTGGWVTELIVDKVWPKEEKSFGKISFALGLVFSMLLTLLPGVLIVVVGAIRLLVYAVGK
jgi:hypothetical protein